MEVNASHDCKVCIVDAVYSSGLALLRKSCVEVFVKRSGTVCMLRKHLHVLQLYISQASLGADITTAKSSEVNVMVPGSTPDADLAEHAIPEQYVSKYENGKYVTLPVSHSGG